LLPHVYKKIHPSGSAPSGNFPGNKALAKIKPTSMKYLLLFCLFGAFASTAQTAQNPVIQSAGTIHDIPYATEKPDPALAYDIVIDVATGPESPDQMNPSLERVARLINLHVVGGVPLANLHIVLAIHNASGVATMNNEAYRKKFKTDNPNMKLIEELNQAGVKITVCGQTLIMRGIDPSQLAPGVEVATSMLTTYTTYQLKGYAALKF
jgi:intracellular sulfur oxidation DsrE/DsrF family protein